MMYVAVNRMHAATVIDFVQLSSPHDHVVELMPPPRVRVHSCVFGTRAASEICVSKTRLKAEKAQAGGYHFVQILHSLQFKRTKPTWALRSPASAMRLPGRFNLIRLNNRS